MMDIAEPIHVTERMLARWGACHTRLSATSMFGDAGIPVTPEALARLLERGFDVKRWVGGVIAGHRRRTTFRLLVEADLRTKLARREDHRDLAGEEHLARELHRRIIDQRQRLLPLDTSDRVPIDRERRYLECVYWSLHAFNERWAGREVFRVLTDYYTRLHWQVDQHIDTNAATREVFALLCQAVYAPRLGWRDQPRDANGRFAKQPAEANAEAVPRLEPWQPPAPPQPATPGTAARDLLELQARLLQPRWVTTSSVNAWLVSDGLTWTTVTGTSATSAYYTYAGEWLRYSTENTTTPYTSPRRRPS